jgi:hypothetical protein
VAPFQPEAFSRKKGLPHGTPFPGPLPIRSSWGEGEEKWVAVADAPSTKSQCIPASPPRRGSPCSITAEASPFGGFFQ